MRDAAKGASHLDIHIIRLHLRSCVVMMMKFGVESICFCIG